MSFKLLKQNLNSLRTQRLLSLFQIEQNIGNNKYHNLAKSSISIDNSSELCSSKNRQQLIKSENCKNNIFLPRTYCQSNKLTICWNCRKDSSSTEGDMFFCAHCGSIKHLNNKYDYFTLFGQENRFSLDTNELTRKFRQLQSVLHPDKFSQKTELEQTLSADWSSLINKAYKTLSTPIDRAVYMLKQHDVTIPEENTAVDKSFLFEMMERNEEVDNATTIPELDDLLLRIRSDLGNTISKLDKCFKESNLDEAKSKVILMRYFISLENSIKIKKLKFLH